jgi:hypothetical protein
MKPGSRKTQGLRPHMQRQTLLDARLAEHFSTLPQPSPDFDQRLFDKIRHSVQAPTQRFS